MENRTDLFTLADCIRGMRDGEESNEGRILVYSLKDFKDEYLTKEYQLVRARGGFGCNPKSSGNAVFVRFCIDGEECRLERYRFIGVANAEVTAYAEQLEKAYKDTLRGSYL